MTRIYFFNNKISIFSLLIFLPVFVSFSSNGGFIFNKEGGVFSEYLYTIPISFMLISAMLFKKSIVLWVFKNKGIRNLFLFFLYSITCLLINYLVNDRLNVSMIRVIFLLTFFLFMLEFFDHYFSKVLYSNHSHSLLTSKYILYPLGIILLITTLSNALIERSTFFSEYFIIYNYEQYYAFIFVTLSGAIMQSNLRRIYKFLVYFLSLSVALSSANTTATLLIILLLIWNFLIFNHSKYVFYKLLLILLTILVPAYYIVVYAFYETSMLASNFDSRATNIIRFFDGLNWLTLLFPFVENTPRDFFDDMHSQFLEVFNALGWIGLFYFFGVILVRLKKIGTNYPDIGVSLAIVIFIGGLVVNTTMHPYLMVCLAYIISFYYRSSFVVGK